MEYLGIAMGFLMFWAKNGTFYLLTGGDDQIKLWPTNMGIRDWVYKSSVRKGILDIIVGILGAKVFNGNDTGMIALTTYSVTCMSYLFGPILWKKIKNKTTTTWQSI